MRHLLPRALSFIILVLLLPLPALAMPAITCHCFTERTYDPARPAAADPYFLATMQNSFFAQVFRVAKKDIVIAKQQGTSAADLWVAHGIATKSGVSPKALLQAKGAHESWRNALATAGVAPQAAGPRLASALQAAVPTARLAEIVVDDLLLQYRLLGDKELAALRQTGAANQELIMAAVIAAKTGHPARQLLMQVKGGTRTWGALLQEARFDTRNLQQEIARLLARPPA